MHPWMHPFLRNFRHSRLFALTIATAVIATTALFSAQRAGAGEQSVYAYGDAGFFGSTGLVALNQPVVGMARTSDGSGYWLASKDGRVASFGRAVHHGSVPVVDMRRPIIGIGSTPGSGYVVAATDGSVFTFGDAPFLGSMGGKPLNQPIVGVAVTPSGRGYWLVARDGGIFSFGDARFFGSTGGIRLNEPIVGIASTPSGGGYWLVARDGGIFSFGDARFFGSTGGVRLQRSIVGMGATRDGGGYWLVAGDGGVFTFGNATFFGSLGSSGSTEPVVGIVSTPSSAGYWIVTTGHLSSSPTALPPEVRLPDGSYRVGVGGIRAGDYREQYAQPGCHWERMNEFSGDSSAVVASNTSDARLVVTLKDGDTFRTIGCAPWTSDIYPVTRTMYTDFGDGDWVVGTDVGAGVWKAAGGPFCHWARVSDFSGEAPAIKALGDNAINPVVNIDALDRGFVTSGCGVWKKG
jgi:hypothetical protein